MKNGFQANHQVKLFN